MLIHPQILADVESRADAEGADVGVAADPFLGFDFLVGGVWVTHSGSGSSATSSSEIVCRTLSNRFLQATYASIPASGTASYITALAGPDPSRPGRLVMSSYSTTGSVLNLRTLAKKTVAGKLWTFQGPLASAGKIYLLRNVVRKISDTELATESQILKPRRGAPQGLTYTRG